MLYIILSDPNLFYILFLPISSKKASLKVAPIGNSSLPMKTEKLSVKVPAGIDEGHNGPATTHVTSSINFVRRSPWWQWHSSTESSIGIGNRSHLSAAIMPPGAMPARLSPKPKTRRNACSHSCRLHACDTLYIWCLAGIMLARTAVDYML